MAIDLGSSYGRIILTANTRGLAQASSAIGVFGKRTALAVTAIGATLAAALVSSVSAAADFEKAFSGLRSVTTATEQQFSALREQALKLGAETAFNATQAAEAQATLAKAGLSAAEILGGALPAALALAAAGEVDLATASETVANAMNLFGLAGREAGRVADILAITANTTATDVGQLAQAFQQGGSAAKQVGLSIEDFTGLLAALAEQGVTGSDAGTSLKAALLSLAAPVGAGAKAIERYGLEFFRTNGQIKSASGIAAELRAKLGDLNQQQRTAVLSAIAGRDGFRALAAAYDLGPVAIDKVTASYARSGAAAETARIKQDNLRGDLEKLGGAIDTFKIKAGGGLQDGLRGITQGLTGLVDAAASSGAFASALEQSGARAGGAIDLIRNAIGRLDAAGVFDRLAGIAGTAFDAIRAGVANAVPGVQSLGAAAVSVLAAGLDVAGRAAADLAPTIGALGSIFAAAGSAVAAIIGPIAGAASALAGVPGLLSSVALAAAGAAVAVIAFGRASVILAASRATGLISLIASLRALSLAAGGAGAAALIFGRNLVSSIGRGNLIAAGIGLVAGAAIALVSAFGRGGEASARIARGFREVEAAAQSSAGAVSRLADTVDRLEQVNIDAARTAVGVARAERELADARRSGDPKLITDATIALRQARLDHTRAIRSEAQEQSKAVKQTAQGTAALIAQQLAEEALAKNLRERVGIDRTLADDIEKLNAQQATTVRRLLALRKEAAEAAVGIRGTGKASNETREQLAALATASPGQLVKFQRDVEAGTKAGKSKGEAQANALKALLNQVDGSPNFESFLSAITSLEGSAVARAQRVRAAVAAVLSQPVAGPPIAASPGRPSGGSRTRSKATPGGEADSPSRDAGKLKNAAAVTRLAAASILATRQALARGLESIDRSEQARQRRRQEADLRRSLADAQAQRARSVADARRSVADAERDLRETRGQDKVTSRQIAEAKRAVADARRSAADALAQGERSVSDARRAIADLQHDLSLAARRAPIELRQGLVDGIEQATGQIDSALSDVISRVGQSLDAELGRTLADLDAGLNASIAAIDGALGPLLKSVDDGLTQALAGIDGGLKSTIAGIDAGLTSVLAGLDAGLKTALGQVDAGLKAALDGIDTALRDTLAAIDASVEAQTIGVIDATLSARQVAREARDEARRRTELTGARDSTAGRVSQLEQVRAQARTASEAAAAERLLVTAREDAALAAEALADLEQDVEARRLDVVRTSLQAVIDARREAATKTAEDARAADTATAEAERAAAEQRAEAERSAATAAAEQARSDATERAEIARTSAQQQAEDQRAAHQQRADEDRAAAQALHDQQRAAAEERVATQKSTLERQLGDLREKLVAGEITWRSFTERVQGIVDDPAFAGALADSGKELGLAFSRGLDRSRRQVEDSAQALAGIVARYLRLSSPAEAGPLAFDFRRSGRVIGADLAYGLRSNASLVAHEAERLAAAAALDAARSGLGRGAGAAAAAAGPGVNQTNHFHVERPVEDLRLWSERAMFEARLAGGRR